MMILIATSNPGKIAEITNLLAPLHAEIRTLDAFPGIEDFIEDASTFEVNAIGKAKWFCAKTNLPTIADDGGMEIDVLHGWPGVHSRRIFSARGGSASGGGDGRRATDEEMISEVLRRLRGVPAEQRGAQMRTVVAFAAPDGTTASADGVDRGIITEVPSEHRIPGFPFRSIFYHLAHGMVVAEAVSETGNDIMTHRRDAVAKLLPIISRWIDSRMFAA